VTSGQIIDAKTAALVGIANAALHLRRLGQDELAREVRTMMKRIEREIAPPTEGGRDSLYHCMGRLG